MKRAMFKEWMDFSFPCGPVSSAGTESDATQGVNNEQVFFLVGARVCLSALAELAVSVKLL